LGELRDARERKENDEGRFYQGAALSLIIAR
jgi:hypothetical protein